MKSDREPYTSKLLGWNEVKFGTVHYISWRNPPLKTSPCQPHQIPVLSCLCKTTTESPFVHQGCDRDVQICFCKKQYKCPLSFMSICIYSSVCSQSSTVCRSWSTPTILCHKENIRTYFLNKEILLQTHGNSGLQELLRLWHRTQASWVL